MGFSIVKYVKSDMNISDLMTKAVDAQTIKQLVPALTGHDLRLVKKLIEGEARAMRVSTQMIDNDMWTLKEALERLGLYT